MDFGILGFFFPMDFGFDFELILFLVDFELGLGWVFQWGFS